jgi:hypothetical protein
MHAANINPQVRRLVQVRLREWQENRRLSGVRATAALAALPARERDRWCRLWAGVEAAIRKAQAGGAGPIVSRGRTAVPEP